jgi:hypothetical protein
MVRCKTTELSINSVAGIQSYSMASCRTIGLDRRQEGCDKACKYLMYLIETGNNVKQLTGQSPVPVV